MLIFCIRSQVFMSKSPSLLKVMGHVWQGSELAKRGCLKALLGYGVHTGLLLPDSVETVRMSQILLQAFSLHLFSKRWKI